MKGSNTLFPPPKIATRTPIHHPLDRSSVIGFVCDNLDRCRQDARSALLDRSHEEHYFRKYNGYAVSLQVLDALRSVRVDRVYIREKDNDRLLEYKLAEFLNDGIVVMYDPEENKLVENPTTIVDSSLDIQHVLPESEATVWELGKCEIE